MKSFFFLVPFLSSLLTLRAADPAAPEADDGKAVASKITDVTVYADRAQVTRVGSVDLTSDAARFAFTKLPGWVDEGSVRVGLTPADAGQILDVQVRRTYLAKASDEDFQKAEAEVREVSDQIGALDDERAVLDAQSKQVEAIRMFSLEKLPKDVAVREIKADEYGQSVEFIASSLRKIATARRDLDKKRRELQPELNARQRKLEELRQRAQLEQRTVVVTAKGTGRGATLTLVYMLPGATWEPVHELRAAQEAKNISLASYAVVTQTTGEDWMDVNLSLSTQRSTETLKIPELDALFVGSGRRIAKVTSSSASSFGIAQQNYNTQNIYAIVPAEQAEYRRNQMLQLDNQKKVEELFEKLQQRGTTAHFAALGRQTVRADGRQVRMSTATMELAAQHHIIAAPEASLNAARTVDLANTTKQSVLPGKVSIYLDGAFLGLTEAEFVAPGESFALYLGVAEQIKLSRTLDRKRSELKRGGQKTRMQVSFIVTVENLSDRPATVQLADRIPVSQMEEVRVSSVRIQPEVKPDVKGLLHWDLNLAAKQSREFRLEYTLEYPSDFTQREEEAKKRLTPLPGRATTPESLPAQIKDLEGKF